MTSDKTIPSILILIFLVLSNNDGKQQKISETIRKPWEI